MKKFASILALMSLIVSVLYGCGSSDDNYSSDYIEQLENGFFDETRNEYQENEEDDAQPFKYEAEMNDDGVYDLHQGDYTYRVSKNSEDFPDPGSDPLLVFGDSEVRIAMFNKNDTAAVYSDVDEITFVKITTDISYTPDLNFATLVYGESGYAKDPCEIGNEYAAVSYSQYDFTNSDEIEINGEDYNQFLDEHTISLGRSGYYFTGPFTIIDAEKGEKITIGGYKETEWIEYDFYADCCFWYQDSYEQVTAPVEKTRNGYFTVDLSGLEPGLYCTVDEHHYGKVIEIV